MGEFPWEFKVFEACGIPVYVHICLVLYFAYSLSVAEEAVKAKAPQQGLPDYKKAGFIAMECSLGFLVLFLTVLIHELGHCLGAKAVGGRVHRILLWPLGGLAFCGHGGGPKGDLIVALAGPLTHGPQWLAWRALLAVSAARAAALGSAGQVLMTLCTSAMSMQVMLFVFNLMVPAYPLDCSKVVISLCCIAGLSCEKAAMLMCLLSVSCILTLLLSMAGIVSIPLVGMGYHPMNLVLVGWMAYQTYQLYNQVVVGNLRTHPLFKEASRPECEPLQHARV